MPQDESIEKTLKCLINLLREERQKQGLSMTQLSEKAGLSQSTISLLENNKRTPGMDAYLRITKALDIDPGQLIGFAASISKSKDNLNHP